jgi:hypothetical protein
VTFRGPNPHEGLRAFINITPEAHGLEGNHHERNVRPNGNSVCSE